MDFKGLKHLNGYLLLDCSNFRHQFLNTSVARQSSVIVSDTGIVQLEKDLPRCFSLTSFENLSRRSFFSYLMYRSMI